MISQGGNGNGGLQSGNGGLQSGNGGSGSAGASPKVGSISFYSNLYDKKSGSIYLSEFLDGIRNGRWQDNFFTYKLEKDPDKRKQLKINSPAATISGLFSERKDSCLINHSGFIAIDIDHVEDVKGVKRLLSNDPYVYSVFTSLSGEGLCALFKIDPKRHMDAFEAICAHITGSYQVITDPAVKNLSRTRTVSYDPDIYVNENALTFKNYLKKLPARKVTQVVFVESDFSDIIRQISSRGINLCDDYRDWISIAFALIDKFREGGRDYFHALSSLSSKYNYEDTDKQYSTCLKSYNDNKAVKATIGLIYYLAKQNGIEIYSRQTKQIIRAAASQKKSGVSPENVVKNLDRFSGIPQQQSEDIVKQVDEHNIKHKSENIVADIVDYLRPEGLKKNLITRNIEKNGIPINDADLNSMYLDVKVVFDTATKDLVTSIIFSNRIDAYNPLHEFFKEATSVEESSAAHPNLDLLIQSLDTDTENADVWVTKWLVSCVASAYGYHSPLVLVLCGELQGTGKSHWIRNLLPKKLRNLAADSKMDAGKDDEILMTKKWIILDDEYGGKSKREEKKLKELTSKEWITVREPYGRVSVDLKRLAVFCGTSNDTQILNDPTGNRRVIPIHILGINQQKYNSCDKDQLWHELYRMYKAGYVHTILKEEIAMLNTNTESFKQPTPEEELIYENIAPGDENFGEWMTITSIIQYLILGTKINTLSNTKIGIILKSSGYRDDRMRRSGGEPVKHYWVKRIGDKQQGGAVPNSRGGSMPRMDENLPF